MGSIRLLHEKKLVQGDLMYVATPHAATAPATDVAISLTQNDTYVDPLQDFLDGAELEDDLGEGKGLLPATLLVHLPLEVLQTFY